MIAKSSRYDSVSGLFLTQLSNSGYSLDCREILNRSNGGNEPMMSIMQPKGLLSTQKKAVLHLYQLPLKSVQLIRRHSANNVGPS